MNEQDYLDRLKQLRREHWPEGSPTEPVYPKGEQPITEYLEAWATEQPDKPALHFYGYDLSYSELDSLSNQFANQLVGLGVQPGDVVSVFLPNCPQLHIAFYGILKCGAVYAPISPLSKRMELEHQMGDSKPKLVLSLDALLPEIEPVCERLDIRHIVATSISELITDNPPYPAPELLMYPKIALPPHIQDFYTALTPYSASRPLHRPTLDDVATYNYTGGTTGLPKGCIHTHRNLIYSVASYLPVGLGSLDNHLVTMNIVPEFWIAGQAAGLVAPVFTGSTLVLLVRWSPEAFLSAVGHYKVNFCPMLVDSVDEILNHPDVNLYDLSSLTLTPCMSLVKKLNADYRQLWHEQTGAMLLESSYGMTETATMDTFTTGFQDNNFDLNFGPTFAGMPVPGTEIKVCDFETQELLPLGEQGELYIRSPSLAKGYLNQPNATAACFTDGWFRTGDLGLITDQGFIRYLGRRKEMIKVNGMSVFPAEVEAMLGQHASVDVVAVVPRKDEESGEKPVAFVVLQKGFSETAESLQSWCKEMIAVFKVPEIRLIDEMPMTVTGKVKKIDLEVLL
jgi:fatty-acyl-CoA synthase/long-chain acyl-CoA synthetase